MKLMCASLQFTLISSFSPSRLVFKETQDGDGEKQPGSAESAEFANVIDLSQVKAQKEKKEACQKPEIPPSLEQYFLNKEEYYKFLRGESKYQPEVEQYFDNVGYSKIILDKVINERLKAHNEALKKPVLGFERPQEKAKWLPVGVKLDPQLLTQAGKIVEAKLHSGVSDLNDLFNRILWHEELRHGGESAQAHLAKFDQKYTYTFRKEEETKGNEVKERESFAEKEETPKDPFDHPFLKKSWDELEADFQEAVKRGEEFRRSWEREWDEMRSRHEEFRRQWEKESWTFPQNVSREQTPALPESESSERKEKWLPLTLRIYPHYARFIAPEIAKRGYHERVTTINDLLNRLLYREVLRSHGQQTKLAEFDRAFTRSAPSSNKPVSRG